MSAAWKAAVQAVPPCVVHEDDDLLVVCKPPGWNTHAPAPYSGEGLYDWLRDREPRWANLSILHRLDKETSGLLVFGKSDRANRSLTAQFTERAVHKRYRLRAEGRIEARPRGVRCERLAEDRWRVRSWLVKAGESQVSHAEAGVGVEAVTEFQRLEEGLWMAEPKTGRTHQIRVHAAALGMPILGDALYGGARSERLWLHSERISFEHPADGRAVVFEVPADFDRVDEGTAACVRAMFREQETDAWRCLHGAAHGRPGLYADRLGSHVLVVAEPGMDLGDVRRAVAGSPVSGVYVKRWRRDVRKASVDEASPQWVEGVVADDRFVITENGVRYGMSLAEGYSPGLFLDQRDNRRRLLRGHVGHRFPGWETGLAGREVLNCFAYTGGFSVCAALAGARTTTLDLSKKYLEWARSNFVLNGLDPAAHDFIYGDCLDWLGRFARKARRFDAVLVDPPTFSRSKEHGDFRVETDYARLAGAAARVLAPGGVLFCSTNAARFEPERFLAAVREGVRSAGQRIVAEQYVPQPPDFPVTREEPAYLKTVWVRVG